MEVADWPSYGSGWASLVGRRSPNLAKPVAHTGRTHPHPHPHLSKRARLSPGLYFTAHESNLFKKTSSGGTRWIGWIGMRLSRGKEEGCVHWIVESLLLVLLLATGMETV